MNFTPGSSGAGPAGFLLCLDGEAKFLEMAPPGTVSDLMLEFIPTRPSGTTGNITCFSHCWQGFSPNAGTARLPQINGNQQYLFSEPAPNSQTPPWTAAYTKLACSEAPSLCLLEKGNKTVTAHQNLRPAVAPGVIRHCQDLPGVDTH